jgi:hypothetical protein
MTAREPLTDAQYAQLIREVRTYNRRTSFPAPVRRDTSVTVARATYAASRH